MGKIVINSNELEDLAAKLGNTPSLVSVIIDKAQDLPLSTPYSIKGKSNDITNISFILEDCLKDLTEAFYKLLENATDIGGE